MNNQFKSIIDQFFSLSPFEFTLTGNIIAYFIAYSLDANQQNALGNLLELMAQVLLTIEAQGSSDSITQSDLNYLYQILSKKIDNLDDIINTFKSKFT